MVSLSRVGINLTSFCCLLAFGWQGTVAGQTENTSLSLPTSRLAVKARRQRNMVIAKAGRDYQLEKKKANEKYLGDLQATLKKSLKSNTIEESQRIKAEITLIEHEIAAQTAKAFYLADLRPASSNVGYGKLGLNGEAGYGNKKVIVNKRKAKHSVSVHGKNNGAATVDYVIPLQFTTLSGAVGLNDSARFIPSSIFRIVGDGQILWESPKVARKPVPFEVEIVGVNHLQLLVITEGRASHTVWLEPVLTQKK